MNSTDINSHQAKNSEQCFNLLYCKGKSSVKGVYKNKLKIATTLVSLS